MNSIARERGSVANALLVVALLLILPSVARAEVATSANYSLGYAVAASSGEPAQSSNYETTAVIRTTGISSTAISSANYSIVPALGSTPATASISLWEVY